MRAKIIQAIKNTFHLTEKEDISQLSKRSAVTIIKDLPDLIQLLANSRTEPKVIAETLEQVVIHIKQEEDQTSNEIELLKQIRELVDNPLYNKEEPDPHDTNGTTPYPPVP